MKELCARQMMPQAVPSHLSRGLVHTGFLTAKGWFSGRSISSMLTLQDSLQGA